ncbi:unnamed protein product, partial [Mesorhabditis spiculigera]
MERYLRKGRFGKRIGKTAPVYLAAVLEYLASELAELSGNMAKEKPMNRIRPREIVLAVRQDDELDRLLKDITIPGGGIYAITWHLDRQIENLEQIAWETQQAEEALAVQAVDLDGVV